MLILGVVGEHDAANAGVAALKSVSAARDVLVVRGLDHHTLSRSEEFKRAVHKLHFGSQERLTVDAFLAREARGNKNKEVVVRSRIAPLPAETDSELVAGSPGATVRVAREQPV